MVTSPSASGVGYGKMAGSPSEPLETETKNVQSLGLRDLGRIAHP